jgi:hypothetical protein
MGNTDRNTCGEQKPRKTAHFQAVDAVGISLQALAATPKAKRTFVTSALANPNASIVMAFG